MVAPSFTDRDASAADSRSSDCSSPMSPVLRMKAPPLSGAPLASSENSTPRGVLMSVVCMTTFLSHRGTRCNRVDFQLLCACLLPPRALRADEQPVKGSAARTNAMHVISVNVGRPREVEWRGRTVRTSIWKDAVEGAVRVRTLNLDGDAQSDLKVHGGPEK